MLSKQVFQQEYLPNIDHTPELFMRKALESSNFYRRASGFFSSTIFSLFFSEYLNFFREGGRMQIMCSPIISPKDKATILEFVSEKSSNSIDKNRLRALIASNQIETEKLEFFGTLLKLNFLDICFITSSANGIFHDKTGHFQDSQGFFVTFRGSSNETNLGLNVKGNFETIEVFKSWDLNDEKRALRHKKYLNDLWSGNIPELKYHRPSHKLKALLESYARDDLSSFESSIRAPDSSSLKTNSKKQKILMDFQLEVLSSWEQNSKRGIIKFATGSGKTVTAISAVKKHIESERPVIICVPSKILLYQWQKELMNEINSPSILLCGDGNNNWKKRGVLRSLLSQSNKTKQGNVILCIAHTLRSSEFINKLQKFEEILFISDECHSLGSKDNSKILRLPFAYRLGLSATPERFNDVDGTGRIMEFFGGTLKPIITLQDAIKAGRLVEYNYAPTSCEMTDDEVDEWKKLTARLPIAGSWPLIAGQEPNHEQKILLMRRARIVKKASQKVDAAMSIIRANFSKNAHWLVYCEDSEQIESLQTLLVRNGYKTFEYTSNMDSDSQTVLREYTRSGGILLSIRCLDEGVDIPAISHALIIASSSNPRQFVQRRGRVIRRSSGKESAEIYDVFAVPPASAGVNAASSIIQSELSRAIEFASSAKNALIAELKLRNILAHAGADPNLVSIGHDVIEEDVDD